MALLMRFRKLSESIVFKNCSSTLRKSLSAECSFSVRKVDIPTPPKRPLSGYMIFCKENRQNVLKEDPSLTSAQQIKKLAAKWSELSSDMKKPYELSARQNVLIYGDAHKKFYEGLSEDQKEELARLQEEKKESRRKLRLNRALQKSGIPKSASTAYTLFVKSEAKKAKGDIQNPSEDSQPKTKWRLDRLSEFIHSPMNMLGLSSKAVPKRNIPKEFIKEIAEKWKNLPSEVKMRFEKESEADKKRFETEMTAWRELMLAEGNQKLLKEFEEASKRKPRRKSALQET